ncbi:MAG: tail fiber domain-containing protein [Candidatus Omnitrophota bacterium]
MKKLAVVVLVIGLGIIVDCANIFAGDGDLIVGGNLGIGTATPSEKLELGVLGVPAFIKISGGHPGGSEAVGLKLKSYYRNWKMVVNDNPVTSTTGLQLWDGTNVRLQFTDNGYVGIGTVTPSEKLKISIPGVSTFMKITGGNPGGGSEAVGVKLSSPYRNWRIAVNDDSVRSTAGLQIFDGANIRLQIADNGYLGVGTIAPSRKLFVNGDAGGLTPWYSASDERLKKNISTIDSALDKVMQLRGVNFEWDEAVIEEKYKCKKEAKDKQNKTKYFTEGVQMGLIAQEVAEVIPEVVSTDGEHYSICYASMVGILVEAVKEQQAQIQDLQQRVNYLEGKE